MSNDVYRSLHFRRDEEGRRRRITHDVNPGVQEARRRRYDQPIEGYLRFLDGFEDGWLSEQLNQLRNDEGQHGGRVNRRLIAGFWRQMMSGVRNEYAQNVDFDEQSVTAVVPVIPDEDGGTAIDSIVQTLDGCYNDNHEEEGVHGNHVHQSLPIHATAQNLSMFHTGAIELISQRGFPGNASDFDDFLEELTGPGVAACFTPGYGICVNLANLKKNFDGTRKGLETHMRDVERKYSDGTLGKWIQRERNQNNGLTSPILDDRDWKNLWLLYVRFIMSHEAFHYWANSVLAAHYEEDAISMDDRYRGRISYCSKGWSNCCYNTGPKDVMNCMLPSENIVKITKFIHPCTKCDGGRGWTGNKGYQYPLEEALANAFALQEIDEQRKGLYGASPKSHIIRILTRTSHWLSAGIGYCHGGEFDGSPWFDAGLRDLSQMMRGSGMPPKNVMHDLRIRKGVSTHDAKQCGLEFGGHRRGLFGSVRKKLAGTVPIKILETRAGSPTLESAIYELKRVADEALNKIDNENHWGVL